MPPDRPFAVADEPGQAPWIPWDLVRQRHGDWPEDPLAALLAAYRWVLAGGHPVAALAHRPIPDGSDCRRCGTCCAFRRPGAVSAATYRRWGQRGALVREFFAPLPGSGRRRYACWYFGGVRLRMCPLLFINQVDKRPFCSIHHLGRGHRPPACGRFRPDPPRCQSATLTLVP